jgi:hypothetical protein
LTCVVSNVCLRISQRLNIELVALLVAGKLQFSWSLSTREVGRNDRSAASRHAMHTIHRNYCKQNTTDFNVKTLTVNKHLN